MFRARLTIALLLTKQWHTTRASGPVAIAAALVVLLGTTTRPAAAQMVPPPKIVWQDVGITQNLGAQVPGELKFKDEAGRDIVLADYYGKRPILLNLVYFRCPKLCGEVLRGVLHAAQAMPLSIGKDYDIITVSFDPQEGPELAAQKKSTFVELYAREGAAEGWHFLTGDEASITRLAETVGFHYKYDPKTDQYAHASGIMLLTPDGRVSKYFYDIHYDPRDVRLGLVESSGGGIGTAVDQVLLLCFHYDPMTGKYGMAIDRMLKISGCLTVLVLGTFMFRSLRRDRHPPQDQLVAASGPKEIIHS